jgi:hypothetical protein
MSPTNPHIYLQYKSIKFYSSSITLNNYPINLKVNYLNMSIHQNIISNN